MALALLVPGDARASVRPEAPQTMVQLSTWGSPALLEKSLTEACGTNGGDLVLTDVAALSSARRPILLTDLLDRVMPFFPGARNNGCSFDRVFVGTIDLAPYYPGNPYSAAAADGEWTSEYITLSAEAGAAFARYATEKAGRTLSWDWYLTFEGMLDYLAAPPPGGASAEQIASGYTTLLTGSALALDRVQRAERFLWSPGAAVAPGPFLSGAVGSAFATAMGGVTRAFADALRAAPGRTDGPDGPLILDLQDHVGSTDCSVGMTPTAAATWARRVADVSVLADLRMNAEMFRHADPADCSSGLRAAHRSAVDSRLRYYASQGLQLGTSFELRFWSELYGSSTGRPATTLEGAEIAEFFVPGQRATLTARLTDANAKPLGGKSVSLLRCDRTWGTCSSVAGTGFSKSTDSTGFVSIETPALNASAHYRLAFGGDGSYGSSEGPAASVYVELAGGRAVAWNATTAAVADPGERSTVETLLTVAGLGWAMEGAEVLLVRCSNGVECADGTPVSEAVAGAGGRVTAQTPLLDEGPPYFQVRFFGNGSYAPSSGPIVAVERATGRPALWSSVRGSATDVGGASVISGRLSDAGTGRPVGSGDVALVRCASATDCANGVEVAQGPIRDGEVHVSTPQLTALPGYFLLRSATQGANRGQDSPIVTLGNPAGRAVAWAGVGLAPAEDEAFVNFGAQLTVAGLGWTMDGARVNAEFCESANHCDFRQTFAAVTVGSGGILTTSLPVTSDQPRFIRWRFIGNGTYATGASGIVELRTR